MITVVKYGSEAYALRKTDEDLLHIFQRNHLQTVLGTRLTDHISNSRLYKKCGSIQFSRAMRERLRGLRHSLQMKHNRLPKIALFIKPPKAKQEAGHPEKIESVAKGSIALVVFFCRHHRGVDILEAERHLRINLTAYTINLLRLYGH